MNIEIFTNRAVYQENKEEVQEENRVDKIKLKTYPEELKEYNKYIEFETPEGKTVDLMQNDEYTLQSSITQYEHVDVQIVFKKTLENDTAVWKSKIFTIKCFDSINALQIVTERQIDTINTIVDTLNLEVSRVEQLEADVQALIADIEARLEAGEFKGEKGDKGDTPIRGVDYWTAEDKQEVEDEATASIEGKIEEYNENAAEKTTVFNDNATSKTNAYNSNTTSKVNEYNQNATAKYNEYNTNAEGRVTLFNNNSASKLSEFNSNAESKTNTYNQNTQTKVSEYNSNTIEKLQQYNENDEAKTTAFNENASSKTTTFNQNVTNKINNFNTNATTKLGEYNSNATDKLEAYNSNAEEKIAEFDEHTEEIEQNIEKLQTEVAELQEDNENLRNAFPPIKGTGSNIVLEGTSKNKFKKFEVGGDTEQTQYSGKNILYGENPSSSNGGAVATVTGNILTISATTTNTVPFVIYNYSDIEENDVIRIKGSIKNSNGRITLRKHGESWVNVSVKNYTDGETASKIEYTVENGISEIAIYVYANNEIPFDNSQSIYENLIMTKNNENMDYEPFVGGIPSPNEQYEQPIQNVVGTIVNKVSNKNFFNKETVTANSYVNANNGEVAFSNNTSSSDYINIENASNVIISGDTEMRTNGGAFYNSNKEYISGFTTQQIHDGINVPSGSSYVRITTTTELLDVIQLESGTTATPYVPHQEQNYPFTLEQGQKLYIEDTLEDDGIHHRKAQGIVHISSVTTLPSGNIGGVITTNSLPNKTRKSNNYLLCNKAVFSKISRETGVIYENPGNAIIIGTPTDTLESMREKYDGAIVEYELGEEEIVPYTSQQQTQYNTIKKAQSYKNKTIISSESEDLPAILEVEAVQDMNTYKEETQAELESIKSRLALLE